MARTRRTIGSALLRLGRQALPVAISGGLITWLVVTVTPARLLEALSVTNWPALVLATAVQVVVLFLWDTVCVWWLFNRPRRRLSFRTVLRLRCATILLSALNLEAGQAKAAWKLSRTLNVPLLETLGTFAPLACIDLGTLLGLALVGWFVYPVPRTLHLGWVSVGGLAVLGLMVLGVKLLPPRGARWLASRPWAGWVAWLDWRTACRLSVLRLVMFLLMLVYAGVCLAVCRVPVDARTVVGVLPFVLLAESLPGTGGLGERETALVYLYPAGASRRAVLLGFGLIWSTGVILGRVLIGLVGWYLSGGNRPAQAGDPPQQQGGNRVQPGVAEGPAPVGREVEGRPGPGPRFTGMQPSSRKTWRGR